MTVQGVHPDVGSGSGRPVRALLADGGIVRMRELDESDTAELAGLYDRLPTYDRFLRFFSAGARPDVDSLLGRARPGDVSVGAFRGEDLIGVAHAVGTEADPTTAEIAMAVAHPAQAHGVGTLLLEYLASRARDRGVRRFVADVLTENSRMWQVITDSGLPVRRRVDGGEVHIELDLTPAEGYLAALAEREERADVASLSAVLAARSIVVVGAGRRPDSVGHVVLESLVRAGFTGQLAAVNPHAGQVCGVTSHRSIEDVPGPVDLAVLCLPAEAVPDVARQCGRAGVRALLVISSGLSADPRLAGGLLDAVPPLRHAAWSARTASGSPTPTRPSGWTPRSRVRPRPAGSGWSPSRGEWPSRFRRSCAGWASACRPRCPQETSTTSAATTCCCGGTTTRTRRWPCCIWSPSATRASSRGSPDASPSGCRC